MREEPNVVGYLISSDLWGSRLSETRNNSTWDMCEPLITVGEHKRIVTALQHSKQVPDGYIVVRDTTASLSTNRLSDKLQFWRAMRPDEWSMDEFIRDAQVLEAKVAASPSNTETTEKRE